jgi:hypothetical protein
MRFTDVGMAPGVFADAPPGELPPADKWRARHRRAVDDGCPRPETGGDGSGAHPTRCTLIVPLFAISAATAALSEPPMLMAEALRLPLRPRFRAFAPPEGAGRN